MNMEEHSHDYESCKYAELSYSEWDTGYSEYECTLCESPCGAFPCPLDFKFSVLEEEEDGRIDR